jgi:thiol-disulfide isomerase/thioredoxin
MGAAETQSGNRQWRRWALDALIFLAILFGVSAWQAHGLPEGDAPSVQGTRTDGVQVAKSGVGWATSDKGKATLVVFWATWCPVCRAEAGNIEAIAGDWSVISVAMQSGDAPAVRKYMKEHDLKVPSVVDEDGTISSDWKVRGVPTHFIIDPSGNIRFRVVGYATEVGLRARLWWAGVG